MLLRFKTQSVRPEADPSRVTGMNPKKTALGGNPLQHQKDSTDEQFYPLLPATIRVVIIHHVCQPAFNGTQQLDIVVIHCYIPVADKT